MSSLIRHVSPVRPERARGLVAEVYTQVNREFSSIGPAVMMLSKSEELMAAGWSLMREAQLAGSVPMLDKAVAALGAALANGVPYEIETLVVVVRRLGAGALADAVQRGEDPADVRLGALLSWASSTGVREPGEAPFTGETAAELVGTVLFTHFIDRVAAAMLPAGLMPGTLNPEDPPAFEDAPVLREPTGELKPGATLALLDGLPSREEPAWAEGTPIGAAYAALTATAGQGAALLSPAASDVVTATITAHRGRRVPAGAWLDEALAPLEGGGRAGAKVALLAGLAPDVLTDEDVVEWRAGDRHLSDHCTTHLLAYGVITAVEAIETDIATALRPSAP
ncbi:hypothetical protein ACIBHY_09405 [Nonomuraea sp. NPDC050547]|uniref:hypothetical protein n=1 Tax=unclassified Nonomuraea TaxID=2593643 RepID=UPI0037A88536